MFNCAAGWEKHCKQISLACVGSACSVWATLGLPQLPACVISWSTLLRLQVALQGKCLKHSGLHELPRSKPLMFRLSGTPQRHRLGWACILCPSQVQAAQATRCLASTLSPGGAVHLFTSLVPATRFPGCSAGVPISGVLCVFSGELMSGCDPAGRYQPSRIPGRRG